MRTSTLALLLSAALASVTLAQLGPAANPGTQGRGGRSAAPILSPQVHPDRTVTFRLQAPKATDVTLTGDWLPSSEKLTKDDNGIWSVTLGPLEPGLAIYSFTQDGVALADPTNPRIKLRARGSGSLVDVPGTGHELWVPREVPHGTVDINWHKSKVLMNRDQRSEQADQREAGSQQDKGNSSITPASQASKNGDNREFRVYTPPGYDENPTQKYPVLYLLHGNNDTPAGWTDVGKVNMILDNLIADKKAVPMIVVMPFGHANTGSTGPFDFERYLLEDVMPTAEKSYRITPDRDHRAIVGYSMGGGQALSIGLDHLDMFSQVGAFSAAVPGNLETRFKSLLENPDETNKKLKLLWFACGRQDSLFARSQAMSETLTTHQIHHTWHPTEGRHTYTVWRNYLIEITPLLFRER